MRLSALTSTCISLAAVAARAGDVPPDPARVAVLEMEAGLARKPSVYLVLDPQRRVLEVRSRGAVLDAVGLKGVEIVSQQPVLSRDVPAHPPIPAVWTVEQGAGDSDREVVEPTELRPAPKPGADEDEPEPTPSAGPAAPTPTPTPAAMPPVSYRNRLANGWDLWITDALPPQSGVHTLLAAVKDGWRRLRGQGEDQIPAVTLAMADEDARRIHHLLRTGMPILVAADM